jgi:hypothetical protein
MAEGEGKITRKSTVEKIEYSKDELDLLDPGRFNTLGVCGL